MTETPFELADVERLSAALDDLDLNDKNRATVQAVFALAGHAVAGQVEEGEVSGFGFQFYTSFKGATQAQLGERKSERSPGSGGGGLFDTFSLSLLHGPTPSP